jgi:hypothetical protein
MAELFGLRASGAPGEEERAMARLEIIALLRLAACEQKLHKGDMPATMAAASALATQFGHESLLIRLDPGRTNAD